MPDATEIIKNLGLSTKAAKIYLAALELGEASVQQLAQKSKLKRTTLYYILDELVEAGVLVATTTGKKTYYVPEQPSTLLKDARERIRAFEASVPFLEEKLGRINRKPRVYFLHGVAGFKEVWDMILATKSKEYRIITGADFLGYVKERYILDEIIAPKKQKGIHSRQLIVPSAAARAIIAKDSKENRVSKLLPPGYSLPFTEIITESMVAFISPRFSNMIFVVEDESFAETRKSLFEMLWEMVD
jgi:HTH-type transcriptional regulator, sugar sensing transcriptional regulator